MVTAVSVDGPAATGLISTVLLLSLVSDALTVMTLPLIAVMTSGETEVALALVLATETPLTSE